MKNSILITGVSGSGKTSVSNKLNELGYKSYDLDDIPGLFSMLHRETKLPIKNHDNTDIEKVKVMTWICDEEKLKSIIANESNNLVFYCGNGSNIYQIMELFDKVILLKVDLETNRHRLTNRTNNDFAKTPEVQDYVLDKNIGWEIEMIKKGAIPVDANGDLETIAKELIEKVTT